MAGLHTFVAAALIGIAAGVSLKKQEAIDDVQSSILKDATDNVTHSLIVCNAYCSTKPAEIHSLTKQMKLTAQPLAYKQCREMSLELEEGERLDFKVDGYSIGIFHATGLPKNSAKLLLVPHLKGPGTLLASFDSHAYSDAPHTSQLAVVDAYVGNPVGSLQIKERGMRMKKAKDEELRPHSVVALNAGSYQVSLQDVEEKVIGASNVRVGDETKHVAMRVGVEGYFEQELVVFPNSQDQSSSTRAYPVFGALVASIAFLMSLA